MAKEHASATKTKNYTIILTVLFFMCLLVNYPIMRWLLSVRTRHCFSSTCERLTRDIRTSMNWKAPPCENFYKFACGKWERNHPGISDQMALAYAKVIAEIVRNLKKVQVPNTNQTAVQKAAAVFQSCVDMVNTEAQNFKPLLNFIESIGLFWIKGGRTGMTLKALDVLVFLSLSVDIDLLFTIDLYEDYADMYSLRISVPKAVMNEYLQDNNWTKERISEVIRIMFGHQEVDDMLNRIVKFERDIEKKLRSVSRDRKSVV